MTLRHYFLECGLIVVDFTTLAPYGNDKQMDIISSMLYAADDKARLEILRHPLIGNESFIINI